MKTKMNRIATTELPVMESTMDFLTTEAIRMDRRVARKFHSLKSQEQMVKHRQEEAQFQQFFHTLLLITAVQES